MNKKFQTITSILIILLLFLLMWVFISYYTSPIEQKETNFNINANIPSPSISVPANPDFSSQTIPYEPSTKTEGSNQPGQTVTDIIKETNPGSVIISSNSETSNAEKQQVLNEIDDALNELLLVIDSVTVVDETRLGIEEEVEVQS